MTAIASVAQRFLPLAAVVLITIVAHRFVPPSVGILQRVFIITAIVVGALWIVSRSIKFMNARQSGPPRR